MPGSTITFTLRPGQMCLGLMEPSRQFLYEHRTARPCVAVLSLVRDDGGAGVVCTGYGVQGRVHIQGHGYIYRAMGIV